MINWLIGLVMMMLAVGSIHAEEAYCTGLTSDQEIDSSELQEFQKEVCRIAIKKCYSSFSLFENSNNIAECVEKLGEDYKLIVLSRPETIEADYPRQYNYNEPKIDNYNAACSDRVGKYDTKTEYVEYIRMQVIDVLGAYQESERGCVKTVDRVVSNSSIFNTNPAKGPLLGSYSINYSVPGSGRQSKTVNIVVTDTTKPTIEVDDVVRYSGISRNEDITVTDNYYPDHHASMKVTASYRGDSNNVLGSSSIPHKGGSIWGKDHAIPSDTYYVEYVAKDSKGNFQSIRKYQPIYK